MQNESGRSMVEMLGVLAVMGLVGLVGVKMYTNAMTRHRANELIYEAQKRATMVASQLLNGRDTLSVAGFTDPAGYTFGVEKNPKNANQFNITITGVSTDICTQMKTFVGDNTPIRHIDDDCMALTFNNDLSRVSKAECTAGGKFWCSASNYCSATNDCCLSGDCAATSCPGGSSTAGTGGKTGIFVGTTECKCPSGEVYLGTQCITKPTTCHSWTTNECGKGYYCSFTGQQTGNLDTLNESCFNVSGTCTKIKAEPQPTISEMTILKKAGFKSTFLKGPNVNWWSAASWCVSQGKHLIDVADIHCYRRTNDTSTNNTLVQAGQTGAYCCKKDFACQQTSSLWDENEILPGKEADVAKFADKIVALRKIYGSKYFWTISPFYANSSFNSCYAFYVCAPYGDVGIQNYRHRNYVNHTICE